MSALKKISEILLITNMTVKRDGKKNGICRQLQMDKEGKTGLYMGTVIDRKWWKRYTKDGYFARGNGQYGYNDANSTNKCNFWKSDVKERVNRS